MLYELGLVLTIAICGWMTLDLLVSSGWRRRSLTVGCMAAAAGIWAAGDLLLLTAADPGDRWAALLENRSEARRSEQRLQLAARLEALGFLTADIAHEANDPLAFIRAKLSQLEKLAHELSDPRVSDSAVAMASAGLAPGAIAATASIRSRSRISSTRSSRPSRRAPERGSGYRSPTTWRVATEGGSKRATAPTAERPSRRGCPLRTARARRAARLPQWPA